MRVVDGIVAAAWRRRLDSAVARRERDFWPGGRRGMLTWAVGAAWRDDSEGWRGK